MEVQESVSVDLAADEELLARLLLEYNEYPERRDGIEAEIVERFQRRVAILVLDSSGFSRTVRTSGVVHFLALLDRLERLVQPPIEEHAGKVIAQEGDTLFAIFPSAEQAVRAALAITRLLGAVNDALPQRDELYGSIGIGFGDTLLIGGHRIAGDEVNLAFKLGEDVAQRGEILVSDEARQAAGDVGCEFEPVTFSVSGIEIAAHRVIDAR